MCLLLQVHKISYARTLMRRVPCMMSAVTEATWFCVFFPEPLEPLILQQQHSSTRNEVMRRSMLGRSSKAQHAGSREEGAAKRPGLARTKQRGHGYGEVERSGVHLR